LQITRAKKERRTSTHALRVASPAIGAGLCALKTPRRALRRAASTGGADLLQVVCM
jgi:hypothetical protein